MAVPVIGEIIYAYNIVYAYIYSYIINIYAYIVAIYAYIVVIYAYIVVIYAYTRIYPKIHLKY